MEIHTFFKFRYLKCTLNENPVEILQILTLFTVYLADGFIIQKGKNIVKRFIDNVLFYFVFYTNAVSQPVFCTDLFIEILLFGIFILFFL